MGIGVLANSGLLTGAMNWKIYINYQVCFYPFPNGAARDRNALVHSFYRPSVRPIYPVSILIYSHISGQTTQWTKTWCMHLSLIVWKRITFGHDLLNFHNFLASFWSSIFHIFLDKLLKKLSGCSFMELLGHGWVIRFPCFISSNGNHFRVTGPL